MNERIKELVLEAGFIHYGEDNGWYNIPVPAFNSRMEQFAELIIQDCVTKCDAVQTMYGQYTFTARKCKEAIKEHFGVKE